MAKTRRQYNQHIHPTERDQQIFRYLGEIGCASWDAIFRSFWPESRSKQACKDRLAQLVAGGYLHTDVTDARGRREHIYWIGRKASLLFDEQARRGFITGPPAPSEVAHVLDMRDGLDNLKAHYRIVSFKPERTLRSEQMVSLGVMGNLGDADLVLAADDGRSVAFVWEVDGKYFGNKLLAKAQHLGAVGRRVIWTVKSRNRLHTVASVCREYANITVLLDTFDNLVLT